MLGLVVDEETMAYTTSAVVAAPDYWALFAEDLLQSLDEEIAYCAFVALRRQRAQAVTWELRDEQGDLVLELWDNVAPPVMAVSLVAVMLASKDIGVHVRALRVSVDYAEHWS